MALVVARTRKEDGEKLYWDGDKGWWPDINRGLRFPFEAEAKEAVAAYKSVKETKGLNPEDTLGYDYVDTDDVTVLSSGPSGNVFVRNYTDDKDTAPNGFANPPAVEAE